MILREATKEDLHPLLTLCKKAWTQLAIPFDTDISRFRTLAEHTRIVVLYDDGRMAAALAADQWQTHQGPAYDVVLLVVDPDCPDNVKALDAVCLYALNIAMSEGRHIVTSTRRKDIAATFYGRDLLGMDVKDVGPEIHQRGDAKAIMQRILERRPQWRP